MNIYTGLDEAIVELTPVADILPLKERIGNPDEWELDDASVTDNSGAKTIEITFRRKK